MSHILIYGQTSNLTELRARLKGWGMSTGELFPGSSLPCQVSVDDCDAVVLDFRGRELPTWLNNFLADHALAAPVLLLRTNTDPTPGAGVFWADLVDEETDDAHLLLELQGAIAHSRQKRGLGAGSPGGSYLHFLGHELRSPLTAAKTALEALQGELQGELASSENSTLDDSAVEASLKMATIAMRNIQRLQQTVEWSQDLLVHMENQDSEEESLESALIL